MSETGAGLVFIVDDEARMRASTAFLLESHQLHTRGFASAREFLAALPPPPTPACALLDIRMPEVSGMALQHMLIERGIDIPLVFMTGHGDIAMAVQAMKLGAVDFIEKPFGADTLLGAVTRALDASRVRLAAQAKKRQAEARLAALSPREWQVARLVSRGLLNKQIAAELGISEKTVHIHRQQVMKKARVSSAAELARLMLELEDRH